MAGRGTGARPSVITDARIGTSLSTDQRTRRYLITMGIRVVAFFAAVVAPFPWNVVLFVAAAILPGFAVLLGNASDNHAPPVARPLEGEQRLELTAGDIVQGSVEDEDAPEREPREVGEATGAKRPDDDEEGRDA